MSFFIRKVLFILFELLMIPFCFLFFVYLCFKKRAKAVKLIDKFIDFLEKIENKLEI